MRGGYKLVLRPAGDSFERDLYWRRTYEAGVLALMENVIARGDSVIDVGANIGVMTLRAAQLVGPDGRVLALEPHPVLHQRLCGHIELNAQPHVRALPVAAGATAQRQPLFDAPGIHIGRASLWPQANAIPVSTVAVETLDTLAADMPTIRFLKIDVEGAEADVIAGARHVLCRTAVVCMEVSAALDHPRGPLCAHDALMSLGRFEAFNFKHGKERPSPLVAVHDRQRLSAQRHDNVVYVAASLRSALPPSLFDR